MITKYLEKLENSKEYKEWKNTHQDSYLAHFFKMFGKDEPQLGYYNKDGTITTFVIADEITIIPEAKVLQENKKKLEPLELSKIKLSLDDAMQKAENLQKQEYPQDTPIKKFAIIQHLEVGQVFNITFLTQTFNTLNIKLDSETGEIKEKSLKKLMEFT
jgi:hypothetical protein